jgi:hypothetical protein
MTSHLKSKPESLQRSFELMRSISKERGLLDLLFVAEFTEKQQGESRGPVLNSLT